MKSFHGRLECVRLSGNSKFRESIIIAIIGRGRVVTWVYTYIRGLRREYDQSASPRVCGVRA